MITKKEESVGYLFALEKKSQGNFGHEGRPGKVGGSASSGGSGGSADSKVIASGGQSHSDVAKEYLGKQRKQDKSHPFSTDEEQELSGAGFQKVEGTDAYIRQAKATPFAESFSMVQVYKAKTRKDGSYKPRAFTATHFNRDQGRWMDSSEHGYSTNEPERLSGFGTGGPEAAALRYSGLKGLIKQVDSYQT